MENYTKLIDHFETETLFNTALTTYLQPLLMGAYEMYFSSTDNDEKINLLINVFTKVIYEYYKRDKVAYLDVDYFIERISQSISYEMQKYIVKYNVAQILTNFERATDYDTTSTVGSHSNEKAVAGSTVVQSTASTPTSVNPNATGSAITLTKSTGEDTVTVESVTPAYSDKYTNFQGKTNGLHDNDVSRDSEITRKGRLLDIIELQNQIPQTLYDELLEDVSHHFIFVYED